VKLEYEEGAEHVTVTIVDMDQNIDVAIPFARRPEEPVPTGDNTKTAILVASMLASGSLIGYVLFSKRKEEE
ncbi:MAG: hypothetical protein IJM15_07045, partial [Erysipelotrichaceae bacterium]|nr:hypothetical protein [Erysipelotrichaceae bacterium]